MENKGNHGASVSSLLTKYKGIN